MRTKFINLLYWMLAVLPLILTGAVFKDFPDTIPVHFNYAGKINRYGSRQELFIFPLVILAIAFFVWIFLKVADNNSKYKNTKIINTFKIVIISTFNVVCYIQLLLTYNSIHAESRPDLYKISAMIICLGSIALANYLPKCRQNRWIGIRTKWTMADKDVWYKTQRFGGWLNTAAGIILIVISLFSDGIWCLCEVIAGEMLVVIVLIIYSYVLFKKTGTCKE